ncbi:iron-siderophore ABC transporter substrate-binding protein [Gloeocapsopsis sp. IPPAS B-1203]|uniref:ABC transporter substrate-binding protein n=1 Tax=Gloeocapsopsis sp. IPPAS B-1203 TaxID=2049454 RepID=UPI000C18DE4B|nr:iron-siderophore ABC transporter substrate-binding protein [Gloeocapsopsis sp. IPPAS B-1203]PIG95192.1 hypothetical protein CSQ79_01625 [Gloeocapsopsis sp. IPPAS B-1203]
MVKLGSIQLLVTFLTVAIGSCGVTNHAIRNTPLSTTSADCRTIEHQMGKAEVCGQPKNIVVLGPNLLELVLALGIQPAGFADHMAFHQGDYDNPQQQIPYIGDRITSQPINVGLTYTPSLEAIVRVQPDLILGTTRMNKSQYEQLSQVAPTLLFEWFDTETNLRAIAQAVNQPQRAEQLLAESQQLIETARKALAPVVSTHPRVLMMTSGDGQELNLLVAENNFCGSLVSELGFQLVYPPEIDKNTLRSSTLPISVETLPRFNNADLVILLGYNWDTRQFTDMKAFDDHQLNNLKQGWKKNAIAQSLDASQVGRVYFIPAYMCLGLPGPIGTKLYIEELQKLLLSN